MSDTLVKVENVSKKFCRSLKRSLWYGMRDIGAELLGRGQSQNGLPPLRPDEFWAVQDINFELKRGDCLGLIGRNGAGKSTLLKMLNGLLKPDTGRIEMRGRIGALIELGTGFNPILTGRENVYVNGSVLGFSKKEIDRKFEAIVEFAEIGDFIDMPVKNYSSGMKVRLGFAVAAQMDPDILLVDEVLAVGDVAFQRKCLKRIRQFMNSGGSIILVAHNMDVIRSICTLGIYLDNGQLQLSATIGEVIKKYIDDLHIVGGNNYQLSSTLTTPNGNSPVELISVEFSSPSVAAPDTVRFGENVTVRFVYKAQEDVLGVNFGFSLWTYDGHRIATIGSRFAGQTYNLSQGVGEIICNIPMFPLLAGNYKWKAAIYDSETNWQYHNIGNSDEEMPDLRVSVGFLNEKIVMVPDFGLVHIPAQWESTSM